MRRNFDMYEMWAIEAFFRLNAELSNPHAFVAGLDSTPAILDSESHMNRTVTIFINRNPDPEEEWVFLFDSRNVDHDPDFSYVRIKMVTKVAGKRRKQVSEAQLKIVRNSLGKLFFVPSPWRGDVFMRLPDWQRTRALQGYISNAGKLR